MHRQLRSVRPSERRHRRRRRIWYGLQWLRRPRSGGHDRAFLYLYDQTSVSGGYSSFGIWPIYGITSTVQVALAFADNNGTVSTTNAFGSDTLFYRPSATVGVTSPHLLSKSNLVSGSLSLSGTTLYDSLSLPSGATTGLYGFTSDDPPAITTEISSISTMALLPGTILEPSARTGLALPRYGWFGDLNTSPCEEDTDYGQKPRKVGYCGGTRSANTRSTSC